MAKHEFIEHRTDNAMQMMLGKMRKCINCGSIQQKLQKQSYGRVTGYLWFPKIGRCKGYWLSMDDSENYDETDEYGYD